MSNAMSWLAWKHSQQDGPEDVVAFNKQYRVRTTINQGSDCESDVGFLLKVEPSELGESMDRILLSFGVDKIWFRRFELDEFPPENWDGKL